MVPSDMPNITYIGTSYITPRNFVFILEALCVLQLGGFRGCNVVVYDFNGVRA